MISHDKESIVEPSLLELAINAHAEMLAAAPLQSMDQRGNFISPRYSTKPPRIEFAPSPWLAIGKSIWISTKKYVYRIEKPFAVDEESEEIGDDDPLKRLALNSADAIVRRVCAEKASMLGPLQSGELILVPRAPRSPFPIGASLDPKSWQVVRKPAENGEVTEVATLLEGQKREDLPRKLSGHWFLDSQRSLWVTEGFDRVYRVESASKWSWGKNVGELHYEDPEGFVWGYNSARIFPGYERFANDKRESVRLTYLNHLVPVATDDGQVICLTPTGLAKVDPKLPQSTELVATINVHWPGEIKSCLGVSGEDVWFVVREGAFDMLYSLSLNNWNEVVASPPNDDEPRSDQ